MSEMIERVTKAIRPYCTDGLALIAAKAAIEAIYQPTKKMVEAGKNIVEWDSDDRSGTWYARFDEGDEIKIFKAMINAALKE